MRALVFEHRRAGVPGLGLLLPRLFRAAGAAWTGRVHERLEFEGAWRIVGPEVAFWSHTRATARNRRRYDEILAAWLRDEPGNPHALRLAALDDWHESQRPGLYERRWRR